MSASDFRLVSRQQSLDQPVLATCTLSCHRRPVTPVLQLILIHVFSDACWNHRPSSLHDDFHPRAPIQSHDRPRHTTIPSDRTTGEVARAVSFQAQSRRGREVLRVESARRERDGSGGRDFLRLPARPHQEICLVVGTLSGARLGVIQVQIRANLHGTLSSCRLSHSLGGDFKIKIKKFGCFVEEEIIGEGQIVGLMYFLRQSKIPNRDHDLSSSFRVFGWSLSGLGVPWLMRYGHA